jgi:hypothetical protein
LETLCRPDTAESHKFCVTQPEKSVAADLKVFCDIRPGQGMGNGAVFADIECD